MVTLIQVMRERNASHFTGEKACNFCGACCEVGPCRLRDMADVERLANGLGKTLPETVRMLSCTVIAEGNTVTPQLKDGVCRFYAYGRCTVHEHRPTGAREFECWREGDPGRVYLWTDEQINSLMAMART